MRQAGDLLSVEDKKKDEMCKSMRLSRLDLNFKVCARGEGKLFWPSCDLGSAPLVLMGKKPRSALRALTSADTHPRKELSAVCRPPDTPPPSTSLSIRHFAPALVLRQAGGGSLRG